MVCAVAVGPLAAAVGLMFWATPAALIDHGVTPTLLPIRPGSVDFATKAAATATLAAPGQGRAGSASGVVTSLQVNRGSTVSTGTTVMTVDGIPFRAYSGERAFHRTLGSGARGEDVAQLQRLLPALGGAEVPVTGVFDAATVRSVKQMERSLGVRSPRGVFDPASYIHIASDGMVVETVDVAVGMLYPAAGTSLFTGTATVASIGVVAPGASGPQGDYVFAHLGKQYPLTLTEHGWEVPDLQSWLPLFGTATTAEGTIRLTEPQPAMFVPPAAIVTGGTGTLCVVLSQDAKSVSVPIQIIAQTLDAVAIDGDWSDETRIVANPAELDPVPRCP